VNAGDELLPEAGARNKPTLVAASSIGLFILRNQYKNLPDGIDDTSDPKSLKKQFLISSPRRAK
jgi:hypothetical protein